jgi:arsenate reductase-like glutaredoxin family protein
MQQEEISTDIIVVQTYFFEILEDIILNGFMLGDERYVCFTASAGQIRTKKTVFIKESILTAHQKSLMCGLTIDQINAKGGVNINKFLAYLALCNSATDPWDTFDINKAIVVEDMETTIRCTVDFIDDKTYGITRQEMDIPITHTDGCGMILPRLSKKSMMIRLPWVKGLLVPFPFDKFIRENNKGKIKVGKVTDIYGKEYDLNKDNIEVVFTKSQFKMWKYYSSWDEYKENYIRYNCQAGKCNEEEDIIDNAKLNYQMLQTLTDITDEEIETLCATTKQNINNIGRDRKTMLKVLGVTDANKNKNYLQQALEIYPELLSDTYSREILKQVKKSLVKQARSGKIDVDGKYTFISPDLYAFCEYLILGSKNPAGLLGNGEVSCNLYKDGLELDCLRSPHLYREHAVRTNVVDKERKRWFISKSVYTSVHDPISRILMFDNDGDKALVCGDQTIVGVAKRNMQGIVPLFYNMAKAGAEPISSQTIYIGLKTAYSGGNIGMISNDITKIWNSNDINLDVIKYLCCLNNFVIDFAKTLYKPTPPKDKKKLISKYTKSKVPYFFIYAKDKLESSVEPVNQSVVNRFSAVIPNPIVRFKATDRFDYKKLMNNVNVHADLEIIDLYKRLDLKGRYLIEKNIDGTNNAAITYKEIKNKLLEHNNDVNYVVDVLVQYLYEQKKSNFKTTLWECFGDVIVENIRNNSDLMVECCLCGEKALATNNRQKYCDKCSREVWKTYNAEKQRQYRKFIKQT